MRALLAAGADVHASSSDGLTPLDLACACGHEEAVRELLAAGAALPLGDEVSACPPLLCAAASGEPGVLAALAEAGAAGGVAELAPVVAHMHGE